MEHHLWTEETVVSLRLLPKREEKNKKKPRFVYQCLLYQQDLCARFVRMTNVATAVVKLVNYISSEGLNHRQFEEFLREVDSENGAVLYYIQRYPG